MSELDRWERLDPLSGPEIDSLLRWAQIRSIGTGKRPPPHERKMIRFLLAGRLHPIQSPSDGMLAQRKRELEDLAVR